MLGPQLAQMNVARLRAPLESPMMAGLVRALADVNWLADQSPGFVWRHRGGPAPERPSERGEGPVTYGQIDGQQVIVTISVWTNYEVLHQYVYRSAHGLFMRQRARWFEPMSGFTTALWWVTEGDEPSVDEALSHLEHLRAHGPTPQAFSLRRQFDPDGMPVARSQ